VPRSKRRVRVERGLYQAGRTYFACATRPGGRQAVCVTHDRNDLLDRERIGRVVPPPCCAVGNQREIRAASPENDDDGGIQQHLRHRGLLRLGKR
jgi:hypothetical protein